MGNGIDMQITVSGPGSAIADFFAATRATSCLSYDCANNVGSACALREIRIGRLGVCTSYSPLWETEEDAHADG